MKTVTAVIRKGEKYYVGECLEVDIVTQGKTVDETIENLKEAVSLYFKDEEIENLLIPDELPIIVPMEVRQQSA